MVKESKATCTGKKKDILEESVKVQHSVSLIALKDRVCVPSITLNYFVQNCYEL